MKENQGPRKNILWRRGFFVLALLFAVLSATPAGAFFYQLPMLDESTIKSLDDKKLLDAYVNVLIEMEARKVFYLKAGLSPKEYQEYKDVLRYRYDLLQEIQKRKLDVPKLEP